MCPASVPMMRIFRQNNWNVRLDHNELYNCRHIDEILPAHTVAIPYRLRGLIQHSGEAGGGHYTEYVRVGDYTWFFLQR